MSKVASLEVGSRSGALGDMVEVTRGTVLECCNCGDSESGMVNTMDWSGVLEVESGVLTGSTSGWKDVEMEVEEEVGVFVLMGCLIFLGMGVGRSEGTVGFDFGLVVLIDLGLTGRIGRGIRGRDRTVEA
jgi:hypothetical protein